MSAAAGNNTDAPRLFDFESARFARDPVRIPPPDASAAIQHEVCHLIFFIFIASTAISYSWSISYCQAAKKAQLAHQAMCSKFDELEIIHKALLLYVAKLEAQTRGVPATHLDPLAEENDRIKQHAGMFSVMHSLFFDQYLLNQPKPENMAAATDHIYRYSSALTQQEGLLAELWSTFTVDLERAISSPERHTTFVRIVSSLFNCFCFMHRLNATNFLCSGGISMGRSGPIPSLKSRVKLTGSSITSPETCVVQTARSTVKTSQYSSLN